MAIKKTQIVPYWSVRVVYGVVRVALKTIGHTVDSSVGAIVYKLKLVMIDRHVVSSSISATFALLSLPSGYDKIHYHFLGIVVMKIILPVAIFGLIVMYFMNAAFHSNDWTLEMFVHNTVRFVSGFVFLGIWVWYKRRLKLKMALYIVLFLLVLDDIIDYFRDIDNLSFEMIIHDTFIVVWGALIGYLFMRGVKKRRALDDRG